MAWFAFQTAVVTSENGSIVGLTPFGQAILGGPALLISFRIQHLQPATALTLFLAYAALLGLLLSSVFLAYTGASVTRVFFISAGPSAP